MNFCRQGRLLFLASFMLVLSSPFIAALASAPAISQSTAQQKLMALEASAGGRLGISATNTANNQRIQYRAQESFPLGSTFKLIGVAAILKQSMRDSNLFYQKVTYTQQESESWSPITEKHIADGMTIFDLSAAAIMYSDNTAISLLMEKLGGPQAVVAFARSIDDNVFTLDSGEQLNPTSTPAAMEESLYQLTIGNVLASSQREQLVTWMKDNTTGNARIRAGVPKGWTVADKTGSGEYGITNDIGIIYPPQRAPIVVTIYYIQDKKDAAQRPDVIATATKILIDEFVGIH